ncbi:MAG: Flagellar assembly protein FliH [Candidatus Scalindua rubra]|uniref:Flagellar assembly protein FliH n=1 Tax=Candidatus Scalindua rubra TaxID=1872076 RepID=A0A1E3X456_9BACT|nr:MAG: Flagellar assembly protein FliH [Candidatus Scalindua rubra]
MSRKTVYKLPVIEKAIVLESKMPNDGNNKDELLETVSKEKYKRGWDDALKKYQEDVDHLCQGLRKAIEGLKQERDNVWDRCEKEIIKLVLAVAKKAVYEEVSKDSGKIIERVVVEAINKVKENKILKLYLNPEDVEELKGLKITELLRDNEDSEMISDIDISRGVVGLLQIVGY